MDGIEVLRSGQSVRITIDGWDLDGNSAGLSFAYLNVGEARAFCDKLSATIADIEENPDTN